MYNILVINNYKNNPDIKYLFNTSQRKQTYRVCTLIIAYLYGSAPLGIHGLYVY